MVELKREYLEAVKKILSEYVGEYEVRAFGSRVHKENLKPFSDLDLVVMTEQPLDAPRLGKLQDAFSASDLPFKVDLVDWSSISEDFRRLIQECFEVVQTSQKS